MDMFWSKKKRAEKQAKKKAQRSEKLREQALANARAAKESLGDETIQKITEALNNMENNTMQQAKKDIQDADPDRVLDELKFMMEQKD